MDDMTAPQKWSQNLLYEPWWLAVVYVINPVSSMLVDGTFTKQKKQPFSNMVPVILGSYHTAVCSSVDCFWG